MTAISLPLSSLWASGSTTKTSAGARGPDAHRKFIVDSTTDNSTRNKSIGEAWGASGSAADHGHGKMGVLSSVGGGTVDSPRSARFGGGEGLVEKDLEMQDLQGRN